MLVSMAAVSNYYLRLSDYNQFIINGYKRFAYL
jgi:hypothetical protein